MVVLFPMTLGRLFYLSECQVLISKIEILIVPTYWDYWGFPGGSVGKESACNAGDTGDAGLILGLRRSPGGEHDQSISSIFA